MSKIWQPPCTASKPTPSISAVQPVPAAPAKPVSAVAPDKFDVKFDQVTGMFIRTLPVKQQNVKEERIVKKLSRSPEPKKSASDRSRRSRSRDRGSRRSRERNRKSRSRERNRSRSRDRDRRSRSRDRSRRSRSRERGRRSKSGDRSIDKGRGRKSRSRDRQSSPPRGSGGKHSKDANQELQGIRMDSDQIRREIEKIQAEKQSLLSQMSSGPSQLPKPVPSSAAAVTAERKSDERRDNDSDGFSGMDNVFSSVLKAVDHGQRAIVGQTAAKILPGAQSFEDIQKYLDNAKKEKLERLKEQNKGFGKSSGHR